MLSIKNLHARIGDKDILNGIDLQVNAGEVHAIMGPNGSGKSTLAQLLAGREGCSVTAGSASYLGQDLLSMPPEERARAGLFMAFQYPVEIPGVSSALFLKTSLNSLRKHRGLPALDAMDFLTLLREKMKQCGIDESFIARAVNDGYSGGEKKRFEILQLIMQEPKLAILDETDSGLDIDALGQIADLIAGMRSPERAIVLVTHYQRLLSCIIPDAVHVLWRGKIVKSGGPELALEIERRGYGWLETAASDAKEPT